MIISLYEQGIPFETYYKFSLTDTILDSKKSVTKGKCVTKGMSAEFHVERLQLSIKKIDLEYDFSFATNIKIFTMSSQHACN